MSYSPRYAVILIFLMSAVAYVLGNGERGFTPSQTTQALGSIKKTMVAVSKPLLENWR